MAQISVIVPVYRAESFIHRCVDSILTQTFTDFELLLVDDGSPDSCGRICDEYAAMDQRVRVFHQTNQGQAAARNHALDWVFTNSDSRYIGFVDSDDWVHPRYLELLLAGIQHYDVNICQCGYFETDRNVPAPKVDGSIIRIAPEEQYLQYYSSCLWDKLFARSCWTEMRFPEGQIYEDTAIWYKMLFKEEQLAYVDSALYYYFVNSNSTVRANWTPAKLAQIDAWEKQVEFLADYPIREVHYASVSRLLWNLMYQYKDIQQSKKVHLWTKIRFRSLLRGKMRSVLRNCREEQKHIKTYRMARQTAYPISMWCHWTTVGIRKKLKRLGG